MSNGGVTPIGYYTAAEVARLAGVSARRIGQWARHEIILPSVARRPRNVYSYADAGEAVLAHYLVNQGKKPREIRQMVQHLRETYGQWPLANAPLEHEGKLVVIRGEDGLYDVAHPNGHKVLEGTFIDLREIRNALSYGGWVSLGKRREYIEVDPDRHSGEPVIRGRRLSTSRVAALAEDRDGRLALLKDYELSDAEIDAAVEYERDVAALAA